MISKEQIKNIINSEIADYDTFMKIIGILQKNKGKQFNKKIIELFADSITDYEFSEHKTSSAIYLWFKRIDAPYYNSKMLTMIRLHGGSYQSRKIDMKHIREVNADVISQIVNYNEMLHELYANEKEIEKMVELINSTHKIKSEINKMTTFPHLFHPLSHEIRAFIG